MHRSWLARMTHFGYWPLMQHRSLMQHRTLMQHRSLISPDVLEAQLLALLKQRLQDNLGPPRNQSGFRAGFRSRVFGQVGLFTHVVAHPGRGLGVLREGELFCCYCAESRGAKCILGGKLRSVSTTEALRRLLRPLPVIAHNAVPEPGGTT